MWKNVGNAGFSEGEADGTSLAFSPSGQPYMAYRDASNSFKATVMKFDGTHWINVGNAGFSSGSAWCESLAFNSYYGQPYIAYVDSGLSYKAVCMKYNGTSWNYVGSAVSIVKIEGQQVITSLIISAKTQIDVSTLPSGLYFVRLFSNTEVYTGKFVKQ
jgi:hypothetical protein